MVKPTFFQKVFGRPAQRYTVPNHINNNNTPGYPPTSDNSLELDLRPPADFDEPFSASTSSPFSSTPNSPSITPPISAASSAPSLVDVPTSTSLPDYTTLNMHRKHDHKLTYTDEDWAKDVRWLVAPRTDNRKLKSKASRRRSASASTQLPTSHSTSSLPARPPVSLPHPPPARPSKSKGIGKAKISTARSVVGMSALLEVEEDVDLDVALSFARDKPASPKRERVASVSRSSVRSPDAFHRPLVSSPLRSGKLNRQRSFSSPPSLLAGDQSPDTFGKTPTQDLSLTSRRSISRTSIATHGIASTSKSPYTVPATNVLDALAAHVSVSDSHDTLPSSGTRGYTNLVLPHAATAPNLTLDNTSNRIWKIGRVRPANTSVRDNIGVGLGFGDKVDLSRARLAQTTMASVEVVRGIAAGSGAARKSRGSVFGMVWFSKDHMTAAAKGRYHHVETDSPLGFTAYRTPPVYVGGGSVLVQVWGVGLDATDARLTGIYPPRASSSSAGAPYSTKIPKTSEKDKGRSPSVGYIPGRSFVGRVLEVGWEVSSDVAKRGDWVVGLTSVHKCGALAEFILADRHRIHRVPNPFMHLKYPFNSAPATVNGAEVDVSRQRDSPPLPMDECLTVNELALLPLSGVPAHRAVRTFHHITQSMGKSQLPYGNSHNELHPILPPRSDRHDFTAGGGQEELVTRVQPWNSRPRALILRAHDGAGALATQMLVREGWSVWAHVPVPFMLPGAHSELPDELKDEEEEKELDNQRSILRRIEDRLRGWGADEVLFVPVTSMPISALFDVSSAVSEVISSWSSPSVQFARSPSSSPSASPSPFSRSTSSTPLSSPYSHGLSSGHLSSVSSSSHQHAFMSPYSFTPLPLGSYDSEQGSVIALVSYLTRSRVRLDAMLDTIGGREIWHAGRSLLSRPVRDPSRQDVDAHFTTLVGDTPDRVVSTAGDNFRAGVRALRLGVAKDEHPFEDSGYHEAMTNGNSKDKKAKARPRPVNYSWVNVVSDIDWEGSDVHDTLCSIIRMATTDGVKPVVGPPDFVNGGRKDKGKKRATAIMDGIEEQLLGKVISFESTPDVFLPGGGLEYGGTVVSRVAA